MAHGIDRSEVQERGEVKSISHEITFEEDESEAEKILQALNSLAIEVSEEAVNQSLFFKTVTIKIRYENFETHTRSKTLQFMTNRPKDLQKTSRELLIPYLVPERKIRLIGVRVSTFISAGSQMKLA